MAAKRKLIEVALPLVAINRESAREKSIRQGHPSTLHLWWARRPLAACRAVLFASLVDDPSAHPDRFPTEADQEVERQRLFALIEELVPWEATANPKVLKAAREEIAASCPDGPPPVLDPFAGGGSIPLEAQRLGLEVRASDLNPVAVLITKALVELPARFAGRSPVYPDAELRTDAAWTGARGLAEDVRRYGAWMREEAWRRIGHLYPEATLPDGRKAPVIAWLWARTVTCPNPACGATMPLVSTYKLVTKPGKERWLEPQVDLAAKTVNFRVGKTEPQVALIKDGRGSRFRCLVCGEVTGDRHARAEGRAGRMGQQPLAVVADTGRGRTYLAATAADAALASSAEPEDLPSGAIRDRALGFRVQAYGMTRYTDLFTARQLVALTTLAGLVIEARERVLADCSDPDYADAVATYLALVVSSLTDDISSLVTWRPTHGTGATRSTFARHALPMVWDYAEANPFGNAAGDMGNTAEAISRTIERLPAVGHSTVEQLDARSTVRPSHDALVCTDPPYYDNIGYADLSDYFYVWLRHALNGICPDLFSTLLTPKREELIASPFRHGSHREAEVFFEEGLFGTFARMREAQHLDFPLTLFYAFKQAETHADGAVASTGWDTMLTALINARFTITGTWPIRTERSTRSIAIGTAALASSIVLVCRPRPDDAPLATRREFVSALRGELPEALRKLQQGNIAPVDLAQAAIGPGMAVFSRYTKVIEADGSTMRVRMALGLINQALDEILAEQEGDFDADTRFAITWFEQYGMTEADFGNADVLARAKNTSVSGMVEAQVLVQRASRVRLLRRDELSADWDPAHDSRITSWEATQHLVRRLETGGQTAAAALLRRLGGGLGEQAKELSYRLYAICDRRGRSAEAVAYNALVVAWPEVARHVAGTPEAEGQQALAEAEDQQALEI
jgi:putative DNA methylase